jgi:hypothetical protein
MPAVAAASRPQDDPEQFPATEQHCSAAGYRQLSGVVRPPVHANSFALILRPV